MLTRLGVIEAVRIAVTASVVEALTATAHRVEPPLNDLLATGSLRLGQSTDGLVAVRVDGVRVVGFRCWG